MERSRLLELVVQLGGEFRRRGMAEHHRKLRLYYVAVKHELDAAGTVLIHYDAKMVVEWARVLRLPPYQDDYPVQQDESCARCKPQRGEAQVDSTFPAGRKMSCRVCGRVWLCVENDTR